MRAMRKTAAAVALGAGLLLVPGLAAADTYVSNQNSSENSTAVSGDSEASNSSNVQSGPQAGSAFGNSQAQQNGDNKTTVRQRSESKSGEAVAGSQVVGSAGHGSGNTYVANQNKAKNPVAVSGNSKAKNNSTVDSGPSAFALFGNSQAQQNGSNDVFVDQDAVSESGDAVSGSQIVGLV